MKSKNHTRSGRVAREARQDTAAGRAEARALLTNEEQVAALDSRLGVGQGAARERARLAPASVTIKSTTKRKKARR